VTRTQPLTIVADADRIVQTLTNLIANAIKFSEPGMIVSVGVTARDAEVLFRVGDEGPGVPPHKLEAIFGRFEQVDASDSRRKGGSGLGLTICRAIVELHGGRIWADSVPGGGATFSFTLPRALAAA
jgi:signal transduction histidine kinase